MAHYVSSSGGHVYAPSAIGKDPHLQSLPGRDPRAQPTLCFCECIIRLAFHDACETHKGEPTETALEAQQWLEQRLDWTRLPGSPVPPAEVRAEFAGSFEWACGWLSYDPDYVREHGLPRQYLSNVAQVFGMADVRRRIERARTAYAQYVSSGGAARDELRRLQKRAQRRRERQGDASTTQTITPRPFVQHAAPYASYVAYAETVGVTPMTCEQWSILS